MLCSKGCSRFFFLNLMMRMMAFFLDTSVVWTLRYILTPMLCFVCDFLIPAVRDIHLWTICWFVILLLLWSYLMPECLYMNIFTSLGWDCCCEAGWVKMYYVLVRRPSCIMTSSWVETSFVSHPGWHMEANRLCFYPRAILVDCFCQLEYYLLFKSSEVWQLGFFSGKSGIDWKKWQVKKARCQIPKS